MFEPCYRGHPGGGGGRQGIGLGLPISEQLAELLGGSLKVADSAGSGAIARLVIPFEHQGSDDARS